MDCTFEEPIIVQAVIDELMVLEIIDGRIFSRANGLLGSLVGVWRFE